MAGMDSAHHRQMMEMHMRMMSDSVIRKRMMADTAMHRMMMEMMEQMPAEQRERMMRMMHPPADSAPAADPHAGHRPPLGASAWLRARPATHAVLLVARASASALVASNLIT
jgi:hypothetical protein